MVYSLLAFLKRQQGEESPRAMRFELEQGKPPRAGARAVGEGVRLHPGSALRRARHARPIRVWGTRRLLRAGAPAAAGRLVRCAPARHGVAQFWVARMGEMLFTLGLSADGRPTTGRPGRRWTCSSRRGAVAGADRPDGIACSKSQRAADLAALKSEWSSTTSARAGGAAAPGAQRAGDLRPVRRGVPLPADHAAAARRVAARAGRPRACRGATARGAQKVELIDRQDGPNLTRRDHRKGRLQAGRDPGGS